MFIAMNRFRVAPGQEQVFIEVWRRRDSHLQGVPGFQAFHLLQGETTEAYTVFASHSVWESEEAFDAWTRSEAFRQAHASAGQTRGIYVGPPQLECFNAVL